MHYEALVYLPAILQELDPELMSNLCKPTYLYKPKNPEEPKENMHNSAQTQQHT